MGWDLAIAQYQPRPCGQQEGCAPHLCFGNIFGQNIFLKYFWWRYFFFNIFGENIFGPPLLVAHPFVALIKTPTPSHPFISDFLSKVWQTKRRRTCLFYMHFKPFWAKYFSLLGLNSKYVQIWYGNYFNVGNIFGNLLPKIFFWGERDFTFPPTPYIQLPPPLTS